MHTPLRVAALVAAEPYARGVLERFPQDPPSTFASAADLLADPGVEPGLVLLGPDVSLTAAAELAEALRRRSDEWAVVCLENGEEGWQGRALSVGWAQPLDDLVAAAGPDGGPPVLELGVVLRVLARARHDINNPLTSALAETQLLLMDVEDGEVREALETIQRQIRRIRDMVAELSALRPPM